MSTTHTTDLYEGPSGSNIHLHGNGEFIRNITLNKARFPFHVSHVPSYTSSPSIAHDKDPFNVDNTLFTCGLTPPLHYLQFEYVNPISSPGFHMLPTPALIIVFTSPSAMPNPSDLAKVVFLPHHGERDSPSAVF